MNYSIEKQNLITKIDRLVKIHNLSTNENFCQTLRIVIRTLKNQAKQLN